MSATIPSNSAVAALVHDALRGNEGAKQRLRQLHEDQLRRDQVGRRNTDTGRGPVGD
jgi:hypothetical protein